jgi:small GTP-binding protein
MAEGDYEWKVLDQNTGDYELSFKMIIIGDSGVGKSCLSLRGTKNIFEPMYSPTIGFEFMVFFIKINNQIIKMQIWDTCGQEVYRSLISSFYNNASLALIVYSIDNENSFNNLEFWLNELRTKANPNINIFLVGNKCDLEDNRKISKELGQEFYENNKLNLLFSLNSCPESFSTVLLSCKSHLFPIKNIFISGLAFVLISFNQNSKLLKLSSLSIE